MKKNGFTLIEIIIAIGLAALILPALFFVFSFSLTSAGQGENFTKAYSLAQKDMESVFYLKNQGTDVWKWDSSLNTGAGEYYQPVVVGGSLELGSKITTLPDPVDGFTSKVEISDVGRCGLNICAGGSYDGTTKKVVVTIGWLEKGQNQEVKIESYVTEH